MAELKDSLKDTPHLLSSDEGIAVVDLADELQVRKQRIFKVLKRLGVRATQRREVARGNQLIAIVSRADAAAVREEISRTYKADQNGSAPSPGGRSTGEEFGVFYVVQLEPDHDPGRFKLGFTTDMEGRLRKHRCSAPFSRCVKTWSCRRTWERTAMDCA